LQKTCLKIIVVDSRHISDSVNLALLYCIKSSNFKLRLSVFYST